MEKDLDTAYRQLKQEYLEMERVHREERESLVKLVNTLGAVVAGHGELAEPFGDLKAMVNTEEALPLDLLDREVAKFKDRIIAAEEKTGKEGEPATQMGELRDRLLETCRTVKRMMIPLLEDFYPLTEELAAKAGGIDIDCREELEKSRLQDTSAAFVDYVGELKRQIAEDFKVISGAFLTLLEQVKELEQTLAGEYGGEKHLKEIAYFEMKVNSEVGLIASSFDIHSTINEIKSTVIEKIENIKKLVALKKKEEMKKAKKTRDNISKLQNRIAQAEKDAAEMTRKAKQLKTAAMQDGLTALFNRKAFDVKLQEAIEGLSNRGVSFSMIMFDLDKFKEINDTFGHVAGDKVLVKVAQSLRETFRKNDFIARYGGDEFAVVVENLSEELAGERVVAFRKNLKKRRFVSYEKGEINITVSAGIAFAEKGDTPESLIDRADKKMFAAKSEKSRE